MLKLVPDWVIVAAFAAVVGLVGLQTVRLSWAQTELAEYKADVAENTRKAEVQARAKEKTMRDSADRIANEQAAKESELAAAAARADATAASLRDEIARLNASPTPTDPAAAALAREATTARKLLGACAERYRGLAKSANEMKDQVTGLQSFAQTVCHAPD
jgi:chromosome segregation ATPase